MVEKRVEFGVFMPVGEGGWIRSTTTPPVPATYAYNRQVAQLADSLGLDFLLAMAKWRGFGGVSGHWDTTIESLTLVAALAEVTSRVRLLPTVHTLAFNVALVAKMMATLDQISNGRMGLNIVSGWYSEELEQMGLWPANITHAERYEVAREWVQALKRLWTEARVTYEGKYIQLRDCISNPKPLQTPHPPLICAGNSDTGLRFTIEEAHAAFMSAQTPEELAALSQHAKTLAIQLGRTVQTYALVMIIPGESDAEARAREAYYREGVDAEALLAGVKEMRRAQARGEATSVSMAQRYQRAQIRDPFISGTPYVGSAESIAQQLQDVIEAGDLDGFVLTFPDFIEDLAFFGRRIKPLLAQAGLTEAASIG